MISRARWQQIQSVFENVIDASPTERATRLAASCGADTDLKRSVESLLASDQRTEDPLLSAISEAAESLLVEHQDRLVGTRVGHYRIVSVLGQGGMSTVYRGERDDAQYQQIVAIKVLHHTALHPRLRNRLHSERHILATLTHPSIARLIDSGDLEDGTPYLVMEHVDGESIDDYCDTRTLFIRERLELFVQVCAAVQYAHRNLVVHRDIKAANILVTPEGTPKLLDFGIAKLLAPENMSHTVPVTRLQERILTPENAAPEQVLGRSITTATDIYALGVLLYQLLTGRSPYPRLTGYTQLQLERAICMDDPMRPSQMVVAKLGSETDADRSRVSDRRGLSPQRLRVRLSGDLDAIIAVAMRKEPERRYLSVEALVDDLNRHLLGKPVLARQGDWRYNTAKFMRRHLLAVFAVSAAFLGLAVIAAVTLWQNHRIELAFDAARQERDRAQLVSGFLVDVFAQADPFFNLGQTVSAKDLLDRGAERITSNVTLPPDVRAELLESIGVAYRRQGFPDRAIKLFEEAVAIHEAERPLDNHRVAAALANLARAYNDAGQMVLAEERLQLALDAAHQADGSTPSVETADILVEFGQFELNGKSEPKRANELFQEALGIYRSALGNRHVSVAAALSGLADAAMWVNDYPAAEGYQRQANEILKATVSRNYPDYAVGLANLGSILTQQGEYAEAEVSLNEALKIDNEVFKEDSDRSAQVQKHLSVLYDRQSDEGRAIEAMKKAIAISTKRHGADHYMTGYYQDFLASLYLKANDLRNAEEASRSGLAVYARALPAQHLYVASARWTLGEILLRRGSPDEAEAEFRTSADINAALAGSDSWRTARSSASLGWALIKEGKVAEGEPTLVAARTRLLASLGPHDTATQEATARLVEYYRSRHRDAEAEQILRGGNKP